MRKYLSLAACLLMASFSTNLLAQEVSWPDSFNEPMKLLTEVTGDFHYPISSDSKEAQRYFDQGFQLRYAFAPTEAARSFRQAQLADPDCAICYWGEAWAWGSYLNGAMTERNAEFAYLKLQEALARIEHASEKEADMIRALGVRYVEDFDRENRDEQDWAFADAMATLADKYPDDLDIVTLYADALFLLEERRGYRELDDPDVIRLHRVLTSVLDRDIRHAGACHLYVHATESTPTPELAAPCAHYLGSSVPGASHLNHMPSHTWNEMGLWDEAVRANIRARQSDRKAAYGQGLAIYPTHNLHMLLYAASMGGQGAVAVQAAKDLGKLSGDNSQYGLTLIRFGRFDEVANIGPRPSGDVQVGMWDFAQGYAALKLGDAETAEKHQRQLEALADATQARYRFHDAANILGPLASILQGEIHWSRDELDAAASSFRQAVASYDRLDYDEPEPLPFAPRHWLGALYLETGEYELAGEVYREDLSDHVRNGWALFGLIEALHALGQPYAEFEQELAESWERADIWLHSSRL